MKKIKVALVHDYLIDYGGAERVLSEFHEIFPEAPIYVSVYRRKNLGSFENEFNGVKIIQSWFGYLPFADKLISPFRFLLPLIWGSFDFSKYDLIITSANWAITKGLAKGKTKEVCYLHAPPRYLYGYDTSRNWKGKWFAKLVDIYALVVNHFMRQYDFLQSQKVNYFLVNSKNVGKRVEKFYRRNDYEVIYPPVDVDKFQNRKSEDMTVKDYYLAGGRLVAAKNFDLIIRACDNVGVKLKIFGKGIEEAKLKIIAQGSVEFMGPVSDQTLVTLYKNAKAFIVAQSDEDLGITPLEAAAANCPVIAYMGGGYLETVIEGKTGEFFDKLTVQNLADSIRLFEKGNKKYKIEDFRELIQKFSKQSFKKQIIDFLARIPQ